MSTAELFAKYNQPVPRYTSFPTANHFHEMEPSQLERALAERSSRPLELYVHIPYCQQLCWYCGCNTTIRKDRSVGTQLVDTLLAELALLEPMIGGTALSGISLGGGTPNFLPLDDLRRLMKGIHEVLPAAADATASTELDPRTVTNDQIDGLATLGFRRFSLGVQSLDDEVQRNVNRSMEPGRIAEIVRRITGVGGSLNLDLMVGLPGQSVATLAGTLNSVVKWLPNRIAVFQYAHVPKLRPAQKLLERQGLPEPTARIEMMEYAIHRLVQAGYERIGFDHFALPDDPLAVANRDGSLGRNFQGYVPDASRDLLAIGPSAIGQIGATFVQNLRDVGPWAEAVRQGRLPVARGRVKSARDAELGSLIEAVMCGRTVDLDALPFPAASLPLHRLEPLVEDGIVEQTPHGFRVTQIDFVRVVAAALDPYIDREACHATLG